MLRFSLVDVEGAMLDKEQQCCPRGCNVYLPVRSGTTSGRQAKQTARCMTATVVG